MRKFKSLAGAALVLQSLAFAATPARAAVGPGLTDDDPTLNQYCQVQPNVHSGFTAIAINVASVQVGQPVVEDLGLVSIVGNGDPVKTYGDFRDAHVNGHSPNIFAYRDYTYVYPTATATYRTKVTTTYQYTFDCHVHKYLNDHAPGNDALHPHYNAPPDQQSYGVLGPTYTLVTYGTRTETINNWTDPNQPGGSDEQVICISPGPHGGSWRTQNGYVDGSLGTCSTDWYTALGGSTPSNSLPN